MDFHQYPNLVIIEKSELQNDIDQIFSSTVIAKVPPWLINTISHDQIRIALHEQLQIDVTLQSIFKFGPDFLIKFETAEVARHVFNRSFLNIAMDTLPLTPWNPYHNAVIVPRETQFPILTNRHLLHTNSGRHPRREELFIKISGIAPHLCCDLTVRRLLQQFCTVRNITFHPEDITYTVNAYGSDSMVPNIVHVALSSTTTRGNLLGIWPVWLTTTTRSMIPSAPGPSYENNTSVHGGDTDLDTDVLDDAYSEQVDQHTAASRTPERRFHHPDSESSFDASTDFSSD